MENNTVLISLEEYNKLRDFKTETSRGNIYMCYEGYIGQGIRFVSESELLKKIAALNELQAEKIKELYNIIDKQSIELKKNKSKW